MAANCRCYHFCEVRSKLVFQIGWAYFSLGDWMLMMSPIKYTCFYWVVVGYCQLLPLGLFLNNGLMDPNTTYMLDLFEWLSIHLIIIHSTDFVWKSVTFLSHTWYSFSVDLYTHHWKRTNGLLYLHCLVYNVAFMSDHCFVKSVFWFLQYACFSCHLCAWCVLVFNPWCFLAADLCSC